MKRSLSLCRFAPILGCLWAVAGTALSVNASVVTTPTMDTDALATALRPSGGLTITSVVIRNGVAGQFGTYSGFDLQPATIRPGVVLSSGDVTNIGPFPEAHDPNYDPSSPPQVVNNVMNPNPDTFGGTPEFDAYGSINNNIQNFTRSCDVAALEVHFTLDAASQIQFDFIFGSVEYPFWTSQYTDAFLVFLDGTDPVNQITIDANGNPVQVGSSFAGLETTSDMNTAFSNPHGLIHHLTTTTAELDAGEHVIIFEVGDVNDQILDSAVFLTRLRAGSGTEGTDPSEDTCPADFNADGTVNADDLADFITGYFNSPSDPATDFNADGVINADDLGDFITAYFNGC